MEGIGGFLEVARRVEQPAGGLFCFWLLLHQHVLAVLPNVPDESGRCDLIPHYPDDFVI